MEDNKTCTSCGVNPVDDEGKVCVNCGPAQQEDDQVAQNQPTEEENEEG